MAPSACDLSFIQDQRDPNNVLASLCPLFTAYANKSKTTKDGPKIYPSGLCDIENEQLTLLDRLVVVAEYLV